MRLSVLLPVYNEARSIAHIVERLEAADTGAHTELVIVDDGSTDGSTTIIKSLPPRHKKAFHRENCGKGSAVRTALTLATGDYVVIQDADLEYDPRDIGLLVDAATCGRHLAVYGVRLHDGRHSAALGNLWGNRSVNYLARLLYRSHLRDICSCYKLIERRLMNSLELTADGFTIDVEITVKLLRRGIRVSEVPISYMPRTHAEGKKITWKDGARIASFLIRDRWRKRTPKKGAIPLQKGP